MIEYVLEKNIHVHIHIYRLYTFIFNQYTNASIHTVHV